MKNSSYKIISIGVDVGTINGAIAIIDEELKILRLAKVPTYQTELKHKRNKSKLNKETMKYEVDYRKRTWVDFREVGNLIIPHLSKKNIYTIERMIPRSNEGESTSFVNGNSLGIFQAMYSIIKPVAYYEPLPGEWKKELGISSLKDTSVELTEDIYQVKLRDYLAKGKVDDIAEALLIAFYGLKKYYNK